MMQRRLTSLAPLLFAWAPALLANVALAQEPVSESDATAPAMPPTGAPSSENSAETSPHEEGGTQSGDAPATSGSKEEATIPPATPEASNETASGADVSTPAESAVALAPESEAEADPQTDAARPAATLSAPREGSIPDLRGAYRPSQRGSLGLDPGAPQARGIVGGTTPSFGERPTHRDDWMFDIHGYLLLPLRVGFNERLDPGPGQEKLVLHTPPSVPGDYESFEFTGVNPDPWSQLNFVYGSSDVTATVIVAARTVSNANGYFNPPDQLGINDAFLTFHPGGAEDDDGVAVNVGAFANRYGAMGQYDLGAYNTPLIARVGGVGATGTGRVSWGSTQLVFEGGVAGQFTKTPVGVEPAGWNGYADPSVGTSLAGHAHVAAKFGELAHVGGHLVHAFSQDDRATNTLQKDGSLSVYGLDVRLTMKRWGHLYFGAAHTESRTARAVSSVVRVLGAPGGKGLMDEYFGELSEGTGSLDTFGAQYDVSLGNFLHYPKPFDRKSADVTASLFVLGTAVSSPVPQYNGVFKLKYGVAGTYTFLPYLGFGARYDLVMADSKNADQHHAILSPRLVFKSDWSSRDQVVLQYSRYLYGDEVAAAPMPGAPPAAEGAVSPTGPDEDVVSLTASMWW